MWQNFIRGIVKVILRNPYRIKFLFLKYRGQIVAFDSFRAFLSCMATNSSPKIMITFSSFLFLEDQTPTTHPTPRNILSPFPY